MKKKKKKKKKNQKKKKGPFFFALPESKLCRVQRNRMTKNLATDWTRGKGKKGKNTFKNKVFKSVTSTYR